MCNCRIGNTVCFIGEDGNIELMEKSMTDKIQNAYESSKHIKDKAFQETWRVLKKDGIFIACFYIEEKSRVTDWLVKNILSKKGWFTPPFHTENEPHQVVYAAW
jgi:hypothetical protein